MKLVKFLLLLSLIPQSVYGLAVDDPLVRKFINEMVDEHEFDKTSLRQIFSNVERSQSVLDAISRPAEKKLTWGEYRAIFIDGKRSLKGVEFWKQYRADLERANQIYGVPPEMIVAILGIETRFGKFTGRYKVIDALSTLAFYYPKRAKFFRKQLKEFLLLVQDQKLDPFSLKGSYAGAMGIPQFIPSSYRHYAIDFDGDDKIDIWNNPVDAIGSVANYFHEHKWKKNGDVVIRATVRGNKHQTADKNKLKPDLTIYDLNDIEVLPEKSIDNRSEYSLLELKINSDFEYWLGMHNFYVITRYNHSHLYAMAAYQLSQEIRHKFLSVN